MYNGTDALSAYQKATSPDAQQPPVTEALENLTGAQRYTDELLEQLAARLDSALSPVAPGNKGLAKLGPPAHSELHSCLIGHASRSAGHNERIRDLIDRLTI